MKCGGVIGCAELSGPGCGSFSYNLYAMIGTTRLVVLLIVADILW